ncbi:hypothetical protein [Vulcanococcus limneticus]|uniref:DUF7734 family protein n=1 Tax=Vulcanococcus limneticus TaxID=2170428 RepID=UPI0018E345E6|nr:hypothetical protein [Vulcanococcus limneticus]MCP9790226.1 hypothetical protein [Vulcanococcus limneticus MW73D5]MCP9894688.1 hypothetical protein [Vulcanococcus limneticus Candia 3F8]MCP9895625.1 hypothetical protein [Vulcanococcus limneticus Candia 3B3]
MPSQPLSVAELLAALEELSRSRADRVLRLRGRLPIQGSAAGAPGAAEGFEPFELLIFRGFSSSVSHPTAFDPDQPALPEGAVVEAAELLQGPLNPAAERVLAGPGPVQEYLSADRW